jgi:hypothetical protein
MQLRIIFTFLLTGALAYANASTMQRPAGKFVDAVSLDGGGGGDDKKEKKGGKEKGDKEDEEDGQKAAKRKFSPAKAARTSAKDARRNLKWKEQAISDRASVRNFFHKTFNTKYGKPVNFRNKHTRSRWRRGRI